MSMIPMFVHCPRFHLWFLVPYPLPSLPPFLPPSLLLSIPSLPPSILSPSLYPSLSPSLYPSLPPSLLLPSPPPPPTRTLLGRLSSLPPTISATMVPSPVSSSIHHMFTVLHTKIRQGLIQGGTGGQMPPKDSSCPPKHMTPCEVILYIIYMVHCYIPLLPVPNVVPPPPPVSTIIHFAPSRPSFPEWLYVKLPPLITTL